MPFACQRSPSLDEQFRRPRRRRIGDADEVRPESQAAINALHAQGIHVVMITGGTRPVAEAVGRNLGVDEVFAEVLPEDKDSMVGDGVNDAPPSPGPTSASPSAPAPTSPSRPPASSSLPTGTTTASTCSISSSAFTALAFTVPLALTVTLALAVAVSFTVILFLAVALPSVAG